MKRDRFRLATVLRVRQIQEDAERGRLALARAGAGRAVAHSDAQTGRYRAGTEGSPQLGSTEAFVGARRHVERLVDAVVRAHGEVVAAECFVEQRRADWSVAAQRVSALDRLRDRHREAFVAAALTDEVLDADERTISRRYAGRLPERLPASRLTNRPTHPPSPSAAPAESR